MSETDVAVIIVNYNTAALALEAVESVMAQSYGSYSIEVHLVDNASPAGDGAVLEHEIVSRGWTNKVTLYRESRNHGFGRGNNIALRNLAARRTPPRYVFLLNPDARLENEAISILGNFLDERPDVSVAGARIEKPGGIPVTSAFRFPGIVNTFSSALAFGPVSQLFSRWDVPLPPDIPTGPVDWVAGAAAMMRFSVVRDVGFFDPAYFLYFEEVDLMQQIMHQGGKVWYVAEAHVVHIEGAATDVKSGRTERRRRPAYWYQSWQHYFQKNHGRFGASAAAIAWIVGAAGNNAIARVRNRPPATPLLFFQDFWAMAMRPILGLKAIPYEQ